MSETLIFLGSGLNHSDTMTGMACAKAIHLAFDDSNVCKSGECNDKIKGGCDQILQNLEDGLKKFGGGDSVDATRVMGVIKATGTVLAFLKTSPSVKSCVESLIGLLGGEAYKKENEVALKTGEALSLWASKAVISSGCHVNYGQLVKSLNSAYDEEFGNKLPPHAYTPFRLLAKEFTSSSPQTRTASVVALFVLVSTATTLSAGGGDNPLVATITHLLPALQTAFVKALADTRGKQLSRECACRGLGAIYGLSKSIDNVSVMSMDERLLKAFGQTTNHGRSLMMETREQEAVRHETNALDANNNGPNRSGSGGGDEDFTGSSSVSEGGVVGVSEATLGAYR